MALQQMQEMLKDSLRELQLMNFKNKTEKTAMSEYKREGLKNSCQKVVARKPRVMSCCSAILSGSVYML